MQVERCNDWDVADCGAYAPENLAVCILMALRDHRTVQAEKHGIERLLHRGGGDAREEISADGLEGFVRHFSGRLSDGPYRRDEHVTQLLGLGAEAADAPVRLPHAFQQWHAAR